MIHWILPDLGSALSLGLYDTSKKFAVRDNHVLPVLFWATACGSLAYVLLMLVMGVFWQNWNCTGIQYALIWVKSLIVGISWCCSYTALATLPLSLAAPIRATGPLWTFIGGLLIYHEVPSAWKGVGMALIFGGYYLLSICGRQEGFTIKDSPGVRFCIAGTLLGAISALLDKYLLNSLHIPSRTVQLHFSVDLVILFSLAMLIAWFRRRPVTCQWRWSIPATGIFLILADYSFFYAVSLPDIHISQVALVRRTSCLVTFAMSAFIFKDKHIGGKLVALLLIMAGVAVMAIFN